MTYSFKIQNTAIKYFAITLVSLFMFYLNSVAYSQTTSFWYVNVGNYLNLSEATQELNRLDTLGFQGKVTDVLENGTAFNQLQVGCFLDEITATSYLDTLKNQLIYPSLSKVAESDSPTTSICLGLETGIELPEQWQIIQSDELFLLEVTLLDYVRLVGFNGEGWRNFQTEDTISNTWQTSTINALNLQCQTIQNETINCLASDQTFTLKLNGELLWQKGNTVILKVENSLKVLSALAF